VIPSDLWLVAALQWYTNALVEHLASLFALHLADKHGAARIVIPANGLILP
jgi:hypothetical protein